MSKQFDCLQAELKLLAQPSGSCMKHHVRTDLLSSYCWCRGMLVKGGRVLDALAQCSTVAFDKTGTLTRGQLVCTGMLTLDTQPFAPPAHLHGELVMLGAAHMLFRILLLV